MKRLIRLNGKMLSIFLLVLLATGCTNSKELYHWGQYESLIYKMYNKPGEATPEVQVERLSRDIQQAESRGLRVPPGVYAHLGVMYGALGKLDEAMAAFQEEKMLYPESATLIDGMVKRASANWKVQSKATTVSGSERS